MTTWLLVRTVLAAPRRLLLEAIGVAFPVAILAATLLFVDQAVQAMTPLSLQPVLVEMRAVGKNLDVDVGAVSQKLAAVPGVRVAEPFAAANVVVDAGSNDAYSARLFAVDPSYLADHPWVRVVAGDLHQGALLDQSLQRAPGFEAAHEITINLPGDAPPLGLKVPVGGTVDLRQALPWFAIPYGEVQGDIVKVPRSLIIDRATFDAKVLPVLQGWEQAGGLPQFAPDSGELPAGTVESHISVDHAAYPRDPGEAAVWSAQLQRLLSREAGAPVVVADDAAEVLGSSESDAINAKILFLLLGIPGVLVAAALGIAVASTLSEAQRRDEALLRLRGATTRQIVRLASSAALTAGVVGLALGITVAIATVSMVTGRIAWDGVPVEGLALSIGLAMAAGLAVIVVRIVRIRQAGQRADLLGERRMVELGWSPIWRRLHLDIVAIVVGIAILVVAGSAGGLQPNVVEGPALALSFYVLLGPILLWIGITLLLVRGSLAGLRLAVRPDQARALGSWPAAVVRWLARRPGRMAVTLSLASLAVGFATLVLAFNATYDAAKAVDARAAIGADLRLTPADPRLKLPDLGPHVAAVTPVHLVPARVDTDRKTILALDLPSYLATVDAQPVMVAGEGPEALANDPNGVLVNQEIAQLFEVGPGDLLPVTSYPDDFENAADLELRVLGVFESFPPTAPGAELITNLGAIPRIDTVPTDFYLARSTPGTSPETLAQALRTGVLAGTFEVATVAPGSQRGLTALNVAGLSGIETVGAGLVAAVGLAVLGAFLILERKREIAIVRAAGADSRQVLVGPAVEAGFATLGSLIIGLPVGLLLAALSVRVLGLFFAVPPPLLVVPIGAVTLVVVAVAITSLVGIGITLAGVSRSQTAAVLRGG